MNQPSGARTLFQNKRTRYQHVLKVYYQACISLRVPRTFGAGPLAARYRAIFGEYHRACTAATYQD